MSITVNILYSGEGDSARNFAKEMLESGLVEKIRAQEGNERYDYFFPLEDTTSVLLIDRWRNEEAIDIHYQSEMMEEIARLRKKYKLRLKVEKFQEIK